MNETTFGFKKVRKVFSRIGLALCMILIITPLLQTAWFFLLPEYLLGNSHWLVNSSWGMWLGTFVPQYLVAIPLALLVMRKLPAEKPQDLKLRGRDLLMLLPISFCVMYAGNIIGNTLSMLLSGGNAQNAVTDYVMDNNPVKIVFLVILAPLLEEYVCRKQIIDRTRQYGEKIAVFLSALTFGLLHQNLFQFFYAFGLGLIFGYIYIRTGRLRYPVLLHSIINFFGGVVAPWIISLIDLDALSAMETAAPAELIALLEENLGGLLIYTLYILFMLAMALTGLVLLILKCSKLQWVESAQQLPKEKAVKTVYWNFGMVLYILLCLSTMLLSLMA